MQVKVQIDRRHDGNYTATVKLVAWELNYLRGLARTLTVNPFGRDIASGLATALIADKAALEAAREEEE